MNLRDTSNEPTVALKKQILEIFVMFICPNNYYLMNHFSIFPQGMHTIERTARIVFSTIMNTNLPFAPERTFFFFYA